MIVHFISVDDIRADQMSRLALRLSLSSRIAIQSARHVLFDIVPSSVNVSRPT